MATRFFVLAVAIALSSVTSPVTATQVAPTNYVIGPQDVLTIAVFDQEDLGGKFPVDSDGTFTFPLIGRVKAGGLTLRELEAELKKQLKNGFFKDPQLSVGVEQYRSQKIHVVGEVRNPGTYPLTGARCVDRMTSPRTLARIPAKSASSVEAARFLTKAAVNGELRPSPSRATLPG